MLFYVGRSGLQSHCSIVIFIEHHVDDEVLPTEISKTSKCMACNQPPKKTVALECSKEHVVCKA